MRTKLYDKRAVKILYERYWSSAGWKLHGVTSPEDFAYAKSKGVLFDPVTFQHDEIVTAARNVAQDVGPEAPASAFLASFSSRELAWRSALGSFATAQWLPLHAFTQGHRGCKICGSFLQDENVSLSTLNFERLKWGGVRHLKPHYAWFDLTEFQKLPQVQPSPTDKDIFKRLLEIASSQPEDARPVDLEKAIAGLFPSSKEERRNILEILGYCGILQPALLETFYENFPEHDARKVAYTQRDPWAFPSLWWRGKDGVNAKAVGFYFPNLLSALG